MSQVIMWFLFPIGLYFYVFKEREHTRKYKQFFEDYAQKLMGDMEQTAAERRRHFKDVLVKNDFEVVESSAQRVAGQKRLFSMSLFTMSLGLYLIGGLVYLLYRRYMQKPYLVVLELP